MLLFLLAAKSLGMPVMALCLTQHVTAPFFTWLQIQKASSSTHAKITKLSTSLRILQAGKIGKVPSFELSGEKGGPEAHLPLEGRGQRLGLQLGWVRESRQQGNRRGAPWGISQQGSGLVLSKGGIMNVVRS